MDYRTRKSNKTMWDSEYAQVMMGKILKLLPSSSEIGKIIDNANKLSKGLSAKPRKRTDADQAAGVRDLANKYQPVVSQFASLARELKTLVINAEKAEKSLIKTSWTGIKDTISENMKGLGKSFLPDNRARSYYKTDGRKTRSSNSKKSGNYKMWE